MSRLRFVVLPLILARCLPAASIGINATPVSQVFTVAGSGCSSGAYSTPQTLNWPAGASCTVTFASPQTGQAGTRYVFSGWQDGVTSNPRAIVTPDQPASYTANFTAQYLVTAVAAPPQGGTVTGGDWYTPGSTATLTAAASSGYHLVGWTPPPVTGSGPTSATLYVTSPLTVTASFVPNLPVPPANYAVTPIASYSQARAISNFGQVAGASYGLVFLWTPVAANGTVGSLVGLNAPTFGGSYNSAAGLNSRGQVAGSTSTSYGGPQAFLWSPDSPNGTTGSQTAFLGTTPASPVAINSYGQIAGGSATGFIWTPLTPNGATGTANTDSRLAGVAALNDFGQAIVNPPMLFTPSAANGAAGSYTPIPGLPGATSQQLIAINNSGTIVGQSCMPAVSGQCNPHGFLWIPATPNGTTGTVAEIPLPAGYVSMVPTALNAAGQVVGTLTPAGDVTAAFLYSGGTVYDLGTLDSRLAGATPAGINDGGQIAVNTPYAVYLLTPGVASPAPGPGSVPITIASIVASGQPFTVSGAGCSAGAYTTPQTLYWIPSSNCTIAFLSPHAADVLTRYLFTGWADGSTPNPRTFAAPSQVTTFTAAFAPQYLVTAVATPPEGGTVSGGGWYAQGTQATLTAAPASGYFLLNWSPLETPPGSTSVSFSVGGPQTLAANFALLATVPPANYLVSPIATYSQAGAARPINNSGQIAGASLSAAFLWTPIAANSPAGSMTDIGGLPVGALSTNAAAGINDRGQVIGMTTPQAVPNAQPFLWSPDTANGTSGSLTAFLGTSTLGPATLVGINRYGQIAGSQLGTAFLWTPASPNGTTGAANTDSRFNGLAAINDQGQAIMNGSPLNPTLFTPTSANGSTGDFTPLPGLPGAISHQLVAINNGGTILGMSCIPVAGASCTWHGFLLRGSPRVAQEIPLPAGFVSMTPAALNGSDQAAGTMTRSDGVTTPFVYTGTNVYDLGTVDPILIGATPAGINDRGQIAINSSSGVYLLTPGAAPPAPVTGSVPVTIASGASLQAFTVAGSGCSAGDYIAPQTLYWTPGSNCTVTFVSPHSTAVGIRNVFVNWQDRVGTNPRVFVAPAQATTYSANFLQQFFLSAAANPPAGGTVSGGGWYTAFGPGTVTATPAAGYRLMDWTPSSLGLPAGTSMTVYMDMPHTLAANFALIAATPPGNYQISQIGAPYGALAGPVRPINNFGQVVATSGSSAFLWTPAAANSTYGSLSQVVGLPGAGSADWASAINDSGQVAGLTSPTIPPSGSPFLWSPTTANGTSGTAVPLGTGLTALAGTLDINNFGQVSGQLNGSAFLWTPSSPNGTAGTINTDSRLNLLTRINDFGQAILNTAPLNPTLFTPSAAHAITGSFTPVFGLPGAIGTQLADINGSGTIVGSSCIPTGITSQCVTHMFLWTPTVPNGASGTAVDIPPPAGFTSMYPVALNAAGQIVGIMQQQASGIPTPFLYSGGTVYDLSTLGSQMMGGPVAGINDRGQIVVSASGFVYLLTPQPAQLPAPTGVTPASGSGSGQTMTFTFTDPRGWQDLDVVNILINDFLDGRHACYLAYSRPQNVLYLVNDAGTGLLPGMVMNGAVGMTNGECNVSAAGFPSGSGNTLTLTLSLAFGPSFAGNKVIYMAARDIAQNNSGWQALGTWGVPGAWAGPAAVAGLNPARGSGPGPTTFTFTFTDAKGWRDLGVVNILVNDFLDGRGACYLAYSRPYNVLYLVNDAGTALLSGLTNSQCAVTGYSAGGNSNTLTLTVTLTFSQGFAGNRVIYLAARDNGDLNSSGWQAMGSWTVP